MFLSSRGHSVLLRMDDRVVGLVRGRVEGWKGGRAIWKIKKLENSQTSSWSLGYSPKTRLSGLSEKWFGYKTTLEFSKTKNDDLRKIFDHKIWNFLWGYPLFNPSKCGIFKNDHPDTAYDPTFSLQNPFLDKLVTQIFILKYSHTLVCIEIVL